MSILVSQLQSPFDLVAQTGPVGEPDGLGVPDKATQAGDHLPLHGFQPPRINSSSLLASSSLVKQVVGDISVG